jgi:hypothetical protein
MCVDRNIDISLLYLKNLKANTPQELQEIRYLLETNYFIPPQEKQEILVLFDKRHIRQFFGQTSILDISDESREQQRIYTL